MAKLSDKYWERLQEKLHTGGRSGEFALGNQEQEYIVSRGMDVLRLHAVDFIKKRLAPAYPKNDGHQTPSKGHPVFIAQHACGCNDRQSVKKFFGYETERELTEDEIELLVQVVIRWLEEQYC